MPWVVGDVNSHKKGLTPEQKKKWVKIANDIYDACMKGGGTDKTCAPKAIRIANSKFDEEMEDMNCFQINSSGVSHAKSLINAGKVDKTSSWSISTDERKNLNDNMFLGAGRKYPYGKNDKVYRSGVIAAEQRAAQQKETAIASATKGLLAMIDKKGNKQQMVPSSAFGFTDGSVSFVAGPDGKKNVEITAYSGKDIIGHWYWRKLAIDLAGMKLPKKNYPVLEDHNLTRKIGFTNKPIVRDYQLVHDNMTFVDTEASAEFQRLSDQGFPYQASIYGRPSLIEEITEGQSTNVNGRKFTGPGFIWRDWIYKEVSVCVFGADTNTKAKALDEGEEDVEFRFLELENNEETEIKEKEVKKMTLEDLKKEDPEGYKELVDEVRESLIQDVLSEVSAPLKKEMEKVSAEFALIKDENIQLKKAEEIRKERDAKMDGDRIWSEKLADSKLPERLHTKIRAYVSYDKFMKDNVLDVIAFSKAIDVEIEDWKGFKIETSVQGFGANERDPVEEADAKKLAEEDAIWLKKMKKFAGQEVAGTA